MEFRESLALPDRTVEISSSIGAIDLDNFAGEIQTAGGTAVWYGVLHARATAAFRRAKVREAIASAQIGRVKRQEAIARDKKSTERSIEEEVLLDMDYQAAQEQTIQAEERMLILDAAHREAGQKSRSLEKLSSLVGAELFARRTFKEGMAKDLGRSSTEQPTPPRPTRQPV